jgi:hypothetical protein
MFFIEVSLSSTKPPPLPCLRMSLIVSNRLLGSPQDSAFVVGEGKKSKGKKTSSGRQAAVADPNLLAFKSAPLPSETERRDRDQGDRRRSGGAPGGRGGGRGGDDLDLVPPALTCLVPLPMCHPLTYALAWIPCALNFLLVQPIDTIIFLFPAGGRGGGGGGRGPRSSGPGANINMADESAFPTLG